MKRLSSFVLILFALNSARAEYPLRDGVSIVYQSDSLDIDGSNQDGLNTGPRCTDYAFGAVALSHPELLIWWYNSSRSGAGLDDFLNRSSSHGIAFWGHDFNTNQHMLIRYMGDGGGYSYAQGMSAISNQFLVPHSITNGTSAMVQEPGWCSTNTVECIAWGPPPTSVTGGDFQILHNQAAIDGGNAFGVMGIDELNPTFLVWSNQYHIDNGAAFGVVQSPNPKVGHYLNGVSLHRAYPLLDKLIDTNVSTACVDWSGAIVATNHNVIDNVTQSGNSLFFRRLDFRLPIPFDVPGTNVWGKTITNDCRYAFVADASFARHWNFYQQVTGCPSGIYEIYHNGSLVATLSSVELSQPRGWNMVTNYVGPYWDKRAGTLGLIRILEGVDQATLNQESAGLGESLVSYRSTVGGLWPASQGDALITAMASKNSQIATNFTDIHNFVQPAPVNWEVRYIGPLPANFLDWRP